MKIIKLCEDTNEINITAGTTGWIPPSGNIATMPVEVRRYGNRAWAVYLGNELLCVTEYLKGGRAVEALVTKLQDALRQAQGFVGPAPEPMEAMAFNVERTVNA